jgi:hypothetical protein
MPAYDGSSLGQVDETRALPDVEGSIDYSEMQQSEATIPPLVAEEAYPESSEFSLSSGAAPAASPEPVVEPVIDPVTEPATEPNEWDNFIKAITQGARAEEQAHDPIEESAENSLVPEPPTTETNVALTSDIALPREDATSTPQIEEQNGVLSISGDGHPEHDLPESSHAGPSIAQDTEEANSNEAAEEVEPVAADTQTSEAEVTADVSIGDDFVLVEHDTSLEDAPTPVVCQVQPADVDEEAREIPVEELTSIPSATLEVSASSTKDAEADTTSDSKALAIGAGVVGAVGITSAVMVNELFSTNSSDEPEGSSQVRNGLSSVVRSRAIAPSSVEAPVPDVPAEETKIDDFEKLNHPAAEVRSLSSMEMETAQPAEESAQLSESFQVVGQEAAGKTAVVTEKNVEADTTDGKKPTVVSVVHSGTQTDDSFPDERPITPIAAIFNRSIRPGVSSEILRAPTPAMVIPDLDDPVAQQLSRVRSLRRQRRNTIKKAEELVAAAVVIKAAVEAVSPCNSPPRLASPVNEIINPEMQSREVKEEDKIAQPVFFPKEASVTAEGDSRGRTRRRSIGAEQEGALRSSVADLFLDDKAMPKDEPAALAPKPDESKAAAAAAVSPKRTSHHSSRRHSHHHDRDLGTNKESPRRPHRHRSDSHNSSRSGGESGEPRTPKRQDSGLSGDGSSSSRRRRTPEEQAAHEKRKEERRLREKEKERERESSKGKEEQPSTPTDKPRDKVKDTAAGTSTERERATSSSHSNHRSSRRHSRSDGTSRPDRPSPSKTEAVSPSSTASKKFFDIKNGQSVLETKFPAPSAEAAVPAASLKDKDAAPAPKPDLKRSRSTRDGKSVEKTRSSSHREKESSSSSKNKESSSKKEVKEPGSASSGTEGEGAASHAHRAKRQERRERAKEEKKTGFRAAIKRFFTN